MATEEQVHRSLPERKATRTAFTVESVYLDALSQIGRLHQSGKLSKKHYDILLYTTRLDDLLLTWGDSGKLKNDQSKLSKKISSVVTRITRYTDAIDMIAQSSPQAYGLNIVGLVWGSLKFLLVIARDNSATQDLVVETLETLRQSLPNLGALVDIYGESELQLLYQPLVDIYAAIVTFGLKAAEYLSRDGHSLKSIAHSAWTSLRADFETSRSNLKIAGYRVEQAASVEHMHITGSLKKDQEMEAQRQADFRGEVRRRMLKPSNDDKAGSDLLPFNDAPMGLLSGHFTGRVDELARLDAIISCPQGEDKPKRCAIVGMPGLGKTQIALQTSAQYYDNGKARSIFWVSLATCVRFTQGYSRILDLVDHVDRDHSDPVVKLAATQKWLERDCETHSKPNDRIDMQSVPRPHLSWLLICDNVNEETLPLLREYLPRYNSRGAIILTARNVDVAKALIHLNDERQQIMTLGLPGRDEAIHLLCAELESINTDPLHQNPAVDMSKAEDLVKSLGLLPFAISQAASFANQSSKDLDYILRLCQGERKLKILSWDNRLATYEQGSVMAIFETRMADLHRTDPLTAMLLYSISLMDGESIPVECLEIWCDLPEPSSFDLRWVVREPYDRQETNFDVELFELVSRKPSDQQENARAKEVSLKNALRTKIRAKLGGRKEQLTPRGVPKEVGITTIDIQKDPICCTTRQMYNLLNDPVHLQLAMQKLQHLALVSSISGGKCLRFHDLAQLMVRQNMRRQSVENFCFDTVARTIQEALFSSGNPRAPGCWPVYERLLPHVQSLLGFHESLGRFSRSIAWVTRMMAIYLRFRGQATESTEMLRKIVSQQQKYHSPEDLDLLRIMATLAASYNYQGNWDAALPLATQVAAVRKNLLGRYHPHYLNILPILATVKRAQGKYQEAEMLLGEALEGFQSLPHERNIKRSMNVENDLAQLYATRGWYTAAVRIYERILHERKEYLNPEDHTSVTLTINLAHAYSQAGDLLQACLTYEQTLGIMEKAWGSEHPQSLIVMNDLGLVYELQNQWKNAEMIYDKLLRIQTRQWGPNHSKTLNTIELLAHTYSRQRLYGKDVDLQRRVVDELRDQHGAEHKETLRATDNLGAYLMVSGKHDEAAGMFEELLSIRKRLKGEDNDETLGTMAKIGEVLYKQGQFQEAYNTLNDALAGQERSSSTVAGSLYSTQRILGDVCTELNQAEKAAELYKAALTGFENIYGWPHRVIVCLMHRLGIFYLERNRWAEAEPLLRRIVEGRESPRGPNHEYSDVAHRGLASALEGLKRYDEAEQVRQRMHATRKIPDRQRVIEARHTPMNLSRAKSAIVSSEVLDFPIAALRSEPIERERSTESGSDDEDVFYDAEAFDPSTPGPSEDTEDFWERACSLPRYASNMRSIYI